MSRTLLRLALLALVFAPASAFALGLGEIHINSALNEPLNAEIELVSATPDELNSVSAALASRETFTRYGLDRPIFLNTITFSVTRTADGRAVLLVRSIESIGEPFVTFLVEVNWARGHLLREYTVLLDPPTFTPGETQRAAAAVTAPQAGEAETSRSGTVQRPEETAPAGVAAAPAETAGAPPATAGGSTYEVRRNDTLFDISRTLRPGTLREINKTMISLFRTNPEAFENNINRLRAGAILRIPDGAQIDSMSADEAASTVAQQYSEWRAAGGGTTSPHLRLVTPAEGTETGGAGAAGQSQSAAAAEARSLRDRIGQLEGQLEEQRRLLGVKDADLARLQQQLAQQQQAAAQAATTPTPQPSESATTQPAETATPTPTPAEATPPAETQAQPAETATTPTPTPAETTPAETTPAEATPKPPAEGEKEGFFASITKIVQPWMLLAGAGAILVVLLAARLIARRRRAPDLDETLGRLAAVSTESTAKFRGLREAEPGKEESFLVEESGERPAAPIIAEVRPERARPEPVAKPLSPDDTISSETAINLDQGDPLAEADFHMAYGLYDQAADLVRIAIERHPERRDLKLKLLEIFFVWGNKDSFLQQARELYETRAQAPSSEWDKIVIMGKQICPDDELFQQARPARAAAAQEVDLNLEGGENRVDVDLLAAPEDGRGAGIDLDLGGAEATAATGESPALAAEGLDFDVASPATTREMPVPTMEAPTVESAAFESPTVEQETVEMQSHDVPTVETPALEREGTIREKIDSALVRQGQDAHADQTAELALDDLGLDLSGLPSGDTGTVEALDEETDHPADAPTMVAGLDETSRKLLEEAAGRSRDINRTVEASALDEPIARDGGTGTWVLGDDTDQPVSGRGNGAGSNATMRVGALPESGTRTSTQRTLKMPAQDENLDLDLDRLSAALSGDTQRQQRPAGSAEERFSTDVFADTSTSTGATSSRYKLDLDVGEAASERDRAPTATERLPAEELALPELEPVTMSEVGTKLDLARAYMDMGDPEGARSILEEVLTEGSASQKQEAQRLIASLPG
jgi:pilus assembly protein FimV